MLARFWKWFCRPARRLGWGPLLAIGLVAGAIIVGAGAGVIDASNRTEFCIGCHEMRTTVYPEYQASLHYDNRSGIRVECADCHVPDHWWGKLAAKVRAVNDLWHSVLGTIDTPEKFEARRLRLATRVWNGMVENDSRECRKCHSYEAMLFIKQDRKGAKEMQDAMKTGKTCIDCHKGETHELPKGYVVKGQTDNNEPTEDIDD